MSEATCKELVLVRVGHAYEHFDQSDFDIDVCGQPAADGPCGWWWEYKNKKCDEPQWPAYRGKSYPGHGIHNNGHAEGAFHDNYKCHAYIPTLCQWHVGLRVECRPNNGLYVLDARDFPTLEEWWTHALCCHRRCAEFPIIWATTIAENMNASLLDLRDLRR